MIDKKKLFSIKELCIELKLNSSNMNYLIHKYRDNEFTLDKWKSLLKKDKLSF